MAVNSFKRIAITIGGLVLITAILLSIYMYYSFKGKSNLLAMVPPKVEWIYHFQTKELRQKLPVNAPTYLDSLTQTVKKLPIFNGIKNPQDVGIGLYSDVILFKNNYGWHFLLKLSSESKFAKFIENLHAKGFVEKPIVNNTYTYAKATNRNSYIVYKQSVMCFFVPSDTVVDKWAVNKNLEQLYAPAHLSITSNKEVTDLLANSDAYYYEPKQMQLSYSLNAYGKVTFKTNQSKTPLSPLYIFNKVQPLPTWHVDSFLQKNNEINQNGFFAQHFYIAYKHLSKFLN